MFLKSLIVLFSWAFIFIDFYINIFDLFCYKRKEKFRVIEKKARRRKR